MEYIDIVHNSHSIIYDNTVYMYNLFGSDILPNHITIMHGFEDLITLLYKVHGFESPNIDVAHYNVLYDSTPPTHKSTILLGFSGGLDSAYNALKLRDEGYEVLLFHINNLNKAYPKEDEFAQYFAINQNFKYITLDAYHLHKEHYIDNPLKNQLILASMIDYGILHNINIYALGADTNTHIEDAHIGMTVTDSVEVNQLFWKGVKKYLPNAELKLIPNDIKKYNRLKYILEYHNDALNDVYSCITPHRFNNMLHNNNEAKYNIKLLDGRCGSCYKCCMEIILLTELGYYNKDEKLLNHCWKILSDSKNSHRKDLFDKHIPLEIRYKNIMNYGS